MCQTATVEKVSHQPKGLIYPRVGRKSCAHLHTLKTDVEDTTRKAFMTIVKKADCSSTKKCLVFWHECKEPRAVVTLVCIFVITTCRDSKVIPNSKPKERQGLTHGLLHNKVQVLRTSYLRTLHLCCLHG